jgi:hypothetical protein
MLSQGHNVSTYSYLNCMSMNSLDVILTNILEMLQLYAALKGYFPLRALSFTLDA